MLSIAEIGVCIVVSIMAVFSSGTVAEEAPEVEWDKTFGGSGGDHSYYVRQTADGGYIIVGDTNSSGTGGYDVYLIKTDASGNAEWQQIFNYSDYDLGYSVQQTIDDSGNPTGYIITGQTQIPAYQILLLRTDGLGNEEWKNTFGQSGVSDVGLDVEQTTDDSGHIDGYIIAGVAGYGDSSTNFDAYLLKTDELGNFSWDETYGGEKYDRFRSVQQTRDGGYIACGYTESFSGSPDVYLVKTYSDGTVKWEKTFGGDAYDGTECVEQTEDDGYIICGYTQSYSASGRQVYVIKTDENGNLDTTFGEDDGTGNPPPNNRLGWKTFGGDTGNDAGKSVRQTRDGGYIIGGIKGSSANGDEFYLIKTDRFGDKEWERILGGPGQEEGHFAQTTADGGYIITGQTNSYGAGLADVYLIKLEPIDDTGPIVSNAQADPNPVAINTPVTLSADIDDSTTGCSAIAAAEYRVDDGDWEPMYAADGGFDEVSEDVYAETSAFSEPGVHTISVRGTDLAGNVGNPMDILLAVYDPDGGFVTGGGWIHSPGGAYAADSNLTGKANFGFVSKYKKGTTIPTGQTEFQFKVADLNFHSDSYDWLVVAGANAKYKGVGTVNGTGNYGFMLTATDEELTPSTDVDLFRIKIWDIDGGDSVVYDNKSGETDDSYAGTAISGGNIKIHKGTSAAPAKPSEFALQQNYPNSFNPDTWIPYQLAEGVNITIRVHDIAGRLIRTLNLGYKPAGFYTTKDKAAYWDGRNEAGEQVASGVYFYTIQAGEFTATKKMTVAR